jgi:NADPH:quinone reductase-like Zn-dependent oxidoreductase
VEGTGRVVAVGPGVTTVSVGDAVLAHEAPLPGGGGFWAERVLVTAAHVASRPPALDVVAAAALPVGALTAAQALEAVQLTPGDRLLVTGGAGGTGVLVVQLAARAGLHVTATASPSSTPRLRRLGAETVIDYHDPHGLEHADGPFDAAVVAAVGTAAAALRVVRDGGRLCALTSDAPSAQRDITTSNLYVRPDGQELARLADTLTDGTLEVQPEVLPLQDGGAALTRVLAGRTRGRKLVLRP